jgi:hypothetical protein
MIGGDAGFTEGQHQPVGPVEEDHGSLDVGGTWPHPERRIGHGERTCGEECVGQRGGLACGVAGPLEDKISLHRLSAGDAKGLLALAGRMQSAATAALGTVVTIASCYEAGYDGFWLHRVLTAANMRTT